ncbi:MAG: hypothetical protein F6J96_11550 [Symploca sp. SIO1C2]|nr:hypothetical protein [Symploca sp. SIO1C2]
MPLQILSPTTGRITVPLYWQDARSTYYWQDASSTLLAGCQFHSTGRMSVPLYWQDASYTLLAGCQFHLPNT